MVRVDDLGIFCSRSSSGAILGNYIGKGGLILALALTLICPVAEYEVKGAGVNRRHTHQKGRKQINERRLH